MAIDREVRRVDTEPWLLLLLGLGVFVGAYMGGGSSSGSSSSGSSSSSTGGRSGKSTSSGGSSGTTTKRKGSRNTSMATYHVSSSKDSSSQRYGWAVIKENVGRKSRHTTKKAAKNAARRLANKGDKIAIHSKDGKIQKWVTKR